MAAKLLFTEISKKARLDYHAGKISVAVRHRSIKSSEWLGYYERKIPKPVYEARKQEYRDKVLQPLETMPNLKQRIEEMNAKDPLLDATVDIGLPSSFSNNKITIRDRLEYQKNVKRNKDLEKQAIANTLQVDLDKVREDWQKTGGPDHIKDIADHYGIFTHLFQHGYFFPRVPLNVFYEHDDEHLAPVYMGNIFQSIQAEKTPLVFFDSKPDDMWTIILTNLDGHLVDTESEYLHWFVGNIKGSELSSGETVCDYLRPFPLKGTGYHRLVFVLYKQEKAIDYSSLQKKMPCLSLKERTFKTFSFYKEQQDVLTPAGLVFYQCVWDPSLTDFFHNVLDMQEPDFQYIDPPEYPEEQVQFAHKKPFNLYLDEFRDPYDVKKEVLLKRLANIHPLKEEPPMPKYPRLHKPKGRIFSWQKHDILMERLRLGKYRDLRPHSIYPQEDFQESHMYKVP